jgi:hypothetical protein
MPDNVIVSSVVDRLRGDIWKKTAASITHPHLRWMEGGSILPPKALYSFTKLQGITVPNDLNFEVFNYTMVREDVTTKPNSVDVQFIYIPSPSHKPTRVFSVITIAL